MSGLLPLVLGMGILIALAVWRYQRYVLQKRLIARLMPHTVSPREAALPIWMRAGISEEVFGLKVEEEALPPFINWMGSNSRRAGLRLGSLDVLVITLLIGLMAGAIAQLTWDNTAVTLAAMIVCMVVPHLLLWGYGNRRVRKMEEQLADMLDATVGALRAGIGLRQALEVVRGSRRPPIAALLNAILSMTDLGLPLAEAFRQTTRHLRSRHFNMLLIALDANADSGSSLSLMLAGMAERIRDSIRLRRRIHSLTAEARFSIISLFVILYVIVYMIWTFRPSNLVFLWVHPIGRSLLLIAIILQLVGIAWTMFLVRSRD